MNPYRLRQLLEEAHDRYFDYTSDQDIAEFIDFVLEINDEALEDEYET